MVTDLDTTPYAAAVQYVALHANTFCFTIAVVLNGLYGRNGNRAVGHGNQMKTVVPFLGSALVWLFTGQAFARGNDHVRQFPMNQNNENPHHLLYTLSSERKALWVGAVRSLFQLGDIHRYATDAQRYRTYRRYLVIIDRVLRRTYVVRLSWHHRALADDIVVEARAFATVPPVQVDLDEQIAAALDVLGMA